MSPNTKTDGPAGDFVFGGTIIPPRQGIGTLRERYAIRTLVDYSIWRKCLGLSPATIKRKPSMSMRTTIPMNTITRTPNNESSRSVPVVSTSDQIVQRTAMGMNLVRMPVIFMNSS